MAQYYPYLIIGGGMAADAAARGIRSIDADAPIGLISAEPDPPYNRPPLSKGLWKPVRPTPIARIWRNTAGQGVEMHLSRTVVRIDPDQKLVTDDRGEVYQYNKLLLATGGQPIRISPDHERVIYYRTLADYQRLRALAESSQRFLVIGGGFVGSEMAAALSGQGKEVSMAFPESGIAARILPQSISDYLNGSFRARGIRVLTGQMVTEIQPDPGGVSVLLSSGETLRVDGVVAGLGIRPNVSLAESAGLITGNGIHVDGAMRTSQPDIYAAGDAANFFSPVLGQRMRVEHEENANLTGFLAGQGMAGQPGSYTTLPSVYSSLFDMNYDAVGLLDPALQVVYDWQEPFKKGVVYTLQEGRVRGVLLWNISRGLDAARELIGAQGPFLPVDLPGRIPAG